MAIPVLNKRLPRHSSALARKDGDLTMGADAKVSALLIYEQFENFLLLFVEKSSILVGEKRICILGFGILLAQTPFLRNP